MSIFLLGCGSQQGENSPANIVSPSEPKDLGFLVPQNDPEKVTKLPTGEEISSEIVSISFKQEISQNNLEGIISDIGATIIGKISSSEYYLKLDSPRNGNEIKIIVEQLRANQNVEGASPDFIYEFQEIFPPNSDIETNLNLSNDQKWGFLKIKALEAWTSIRDRSKDLSTVVVGVIDTGFACTPSS